MLDSLKDRLKETWAELAAKIQESSLFNQLRERFEEQTPTTQKALTLGGAALIALVLLSFPLGYLSTSRENITQFEENRALIQGLLRAARSAKEPSPLPPPVSAQMLKGTLERVLREKQISPEQTGEVMEIPGKPAPNLAPPVVEQSGIAAHLKQLNLTQIVDLANALANLGPGTKLIGLDVVQTAGQTHYYDINVKLVNFGLPTIAGDVDQAPPARRGGAGGRPGGAPPKRAAPADEGDEE